MKPTGSLALDSSIIIRHMRMADPAIAAGLTWLPFCSLAMKLPNMHFEMRRTRRRANHESEGGCHKV